MTISRRNTSSSPTGLAAPPVAPAPPRPSPEERTDRPTEDRSGDDRAARREERLAEMVAELTGCAPAGALEAVKANTDHADPLETVARAMIAVERPADDGLRVTGYLRPRPARRRTTRRSDQPGFAAPRPHPSVVAPAAEAEVTLTTSGDDAADGAAVDPATAGRTDIGTAGTAAGDPSADDRWPDDVVMDLRGDEPEVLIDLTMLDRMARVRRQHRRR
jgi:hypothetical protein